MLDGSIAVLDDIVGIIDIDWYFKVPAYICGIIYLIFRTLKMRVDYKIAELDREIKKKNTEILNQLSASKEHHERIKELEKLVEIKERRLRN